jgi:NitT/TauT family transport system substrate-binding protein
MAWKSEKITTPADMRDKRLGILATGSEYEITAALKRAGLTPGTDVTTVETGPTVAAFLHGQVDTAQALIYDQYAQVLEARDPKTGALYAPTALDVINYNDVGTAMLQDAIFARAGWLDGPANEELATVFLKASFEGWIYCREHPDDCVGYAATAAATQPPQGGPGPSGGPSPGAGGSAAASPPASASATPAPSAGASGEPIPGTGHQAWMLNELNPLIWPSPDGIGVVDRDAWQATVGVLRSSGLIAADPPAEAYRTDLASAALARLTDTDTTGAAFVKGTVEITPGGD